MLRSSFKLLKTESRSVVQSQGQKISKLQVVKITQQQESRLAGQGQFQLESTGKIVWHEFHEYSFKTEIRSVAERIKAESMQELICTIKTSLLQLKSKKQVSRSKCVLYVKVGSYTQNCIYGSNFIGKDYKKTTKKQVSRSR